MQYYLPTVEIKDYNAMIGGRNFFDQTIKNGLQHIITLERFQGDDYTTGCLLGCPYFKKYYKPIAIDLSRQQKLDADLKVIQKINFTRNLDRAEDATTFFIVVETKETVLNVSKVTVKVLQLHFLSFNIASKKNCLIHNLIS